MTSSSWLTPSVRPDRTRGSRSRWGQTSRSRPCCLISSVMECVKACLCLWYSTQRPMCHGGLHHLQQRPVSPPFLVVVMKFFNICHFPSSLNDGMLIRMLPLKTLKWDSAWARNREWFLIYNIAGDMVLIILTASGTVPLLQWTINLDDLVILKCFWNSLHNTVRVHTVPNNIVFNTLAGGPCQGLVKQKVHRTPLRVDVDAWFSFYVRALASGCAR